MKQIGLNLVEKNWSEYRFKQGTDNYPFQKLSLAIIFPICAVLIFKIEFITIFRYCKLPLVNEKLF